MRIIAGKCRHLPLKTPEGLNTRPTQDRIKETLFNMIQSQLFDCDFLDLFAGSGGIGLEALSRGANSCVFVEQNKEAIACIEDNISFTKLNDQARLIKEDVFCALKKLEAEGHTPFSIIFMDPPYNKELEKQVLDYLKTSSLIDADTLIIVESDLNTDFSYLDEYGFECTKFKKYKTNAHSFIYLKE